MEVPLLVDDFLRRAVRVYSDKTAVVDGEVRLDYGTLAERVNRLSNALRSLGVQKGDRICILSPNSHFFLESFYATSQIGAILVPLNFRLTSADHAYILNHAGVRTLLVDHEYTHVVDEIIDDLPAVQDRIVARDDVTEPPPGWLDWNQLIAAEASTPPPAISVDENDLVSLNYTSGTTARPKGVMLTHRNCYLNAYNMIAHLGIRHDDVELWTLPMFHCNGWGGVYALTGMGGTHVILRSVEGRRIFELISGEGVTFACMAPAVLRTILDYPEKDAYPITTQPRFTVAGAPPPAAFIQRLEEELGWSFVQIYGLTETAPLLTVNHPDHNVEQQDYAQRARAGTPGIGVEIAVLDDDGEKVPQDGQTIGEVCARSNVVFKGYYEQPDQTEAAMAGGWFHTGDLGVWDQTQCIHIVDRKKDVIISGGENISSAEIEDVLYQHPSIEECAVIGVPHEKWGETPKALVVLRANETSNEEALLEFCRNQMSHFKCPTSIDFVSELPRTATGKLQKFKLREPFWAGQRRVN
ncbi:long-chain-fatty-acid--CoA ligase [Myxococcota bacterium]|nr:long-chain-fatty-acid--CoA ligase [Myxococcota bacterium]